MPVRTDMLQILIKGVPSAEAAHQRIADHAKAVQDLARQPPQPIRVNVSPHGCGRCGNPYTEQGPDGTCTACADTLGV